MWELWGFKALIWPLRDAPTPHHQAKWKEPCSYDLQSLAARAKGVGTCKRQKAPAGNGHLSMLILYRQGASASAKITGCALLLSVPAPRPEPCMEQGDFDRQQDAPAAPCTSLCHRCQGPCSSGENFRSFLQATAMCRQSHFSPGLNKLQSRYNASFLPRCLFDMKPY